MLTQISSHIALNATGSLKREIFKGEDSSKASSRKVSNKLSLDVELKNLEKSSIEIDGSKCGICCKKLGIRGYKCKCLYSFCTKHRLPEIHECTFDFIEEAKHKLKKNNQKVIRDKIERI